MRVNITSGIANKIIATPTFNSSLKVYPNPANDKVTIEYSSEQTGTYTLQLSDLKGRILQKNYRNNLKGITKITFDLSAYSKGIYVLELMDAKANIQITKLIKQ